MKSALICAAWFGAVAAGAADVDYFPLQVGNRWVLQTSASAPEILSMEVLRSRVIDNTTWYLVSGYAPGQRWIRKAADGTVYAFDENTGAEEALAKLTPGAARYRTALGGCAQSAQSGAATAYRGPNYTFENALPVGYFPEGCADIGITQEVYAPGVGLATRSITTFRGEIVYHLVYAKVGGAPVLGKSKEIVVLDDFHSGSKGWLAGFADYSRLTGDFRMLAELRPLPDEINSARSGFYLQGMNRSDDLFMFLKKHVGSEDGIEPNQAYRVAFDLRFASNEPTGCFGVGGSPGDSVYLKAGATADEPVALLDTLGEIRLSADKGQQANGGKDAGVVGTIANGTPCEGTTHPYVRVRKEYAHATDIRTDDRGSMWLLVGTDSGYEGLTGLYLESIAIRINPAVAPAKLVGAARKPRR
jgi:hypothetical protein